MFLTRWLFSALGPWLNFVAGAAGFATSRFLVFTVLGEALWVMLFLGTGYAFGTNLSAASDMLGSLLGVLGGLGAMIGLGYWLWLHMRHRPV